MKAAKGVVRFESVLIKSENAIGWHYLLVDAKIADKFKSSGNSRRVLCTLNGKYTFQCGLMPLGRDFYIIVNKKARDRVGIAAGHSVKVELKRDESKYGLPMPAELREVLNQDPEGDRFFHALTSGKQRSIIYFIGKTKDEDRRIQLALIFIGHLKRNSGKIVHDLLTEELKRPIF